MMVRTLRCEPIGGQVPTFELVFFLTMEAFGRVHFSQRHYAQISAYPPAARVKSRQRHCFVKGKQGVAARLCTAAPCGKS